VFVSWSLSTSIHALLDALAHFLLQQGLPEATTKFWVCDFVIRQTDVKADLEWLGPCVEAIGHTVLLMQPWRDPEPLRRAYCIKEIYHTQVGRAKLDVTMSTYQQIDFRGALLGDEGGAIMTALSQIDVQQADCRNENEKAAILKELEDGVGFLECNRVVIGALREGWVAYAKALLRDNKWDRGCRGLSKLLFKVSNLLKDMGKLEEARPLMEEQMHAYRETFGIRDERTLAAINNLAVLLQQTGQLEHARALLEECLPIQRETLGSDHSETLTTISNMAGLLQDMGKHEEAMPLCEEDLEACRKKYGRCHSATLISMNNMADSLMKLGQREEARRLFEEAVQTGRETVGDRDPSTLTSMNNLGNLLKEMGAREEAQQLLEKVLVARRAMLGNDHPKTLTSIHNLAILLYEMGQREAATPLLKEALAGANETLGKEHHLTQSYQQDLDICNADT